MVISIEADSYNHKPGETINPLNTLYVKHPFDVLLITLVNKTGTSKITLLLGFLLSQDMAFESMLSFNLACPCKLKPFLSA